VPLVDFAAVFRDSRGQSIVETALALPILVFLLLGGADMARAYSAQLAVQNGARAGAEGLALDSTPTGTEAIAHAQNEMSRTPGITATNATITVTFTQSNGTSPCTGSVSTSVSGTSTIASPCYGNVRVRYTYHTIVAWPLFPNTFYFDRTTKVRRYQ
jgi:Flp pilus assembly protein TadG